MSQGDINRCSRSFFKRGKHNGVTVKKCAFCEKSLSGKNRTKEHIIPNALGGRKKTVEFICNTCS